MADKWLTPATPGTLAAMAASIRMAAEREIMDTLQGLEYIRDNKGADITTGTILVSADDLLRAALEVPLSCSECGTHSELIGADGECRRCRLQQPRISPGLLEDDLPF